MKGFLSRVWVIIIAGAFVASCDLQPKISSVPDAVGDFISVRYPTLLADPETESEIYNSAVTDYGVYESPELYGSESIGDYINYANADDYVLKEPEPIGYVEKNEDVEPETKPEQISVSEPQQPEPSDTLTVNDYVAPEKQDTPIKNDALIIPEKKVEKTGQKTNEIIVKKGDTLYAIAKQNNTTTEKLIAANDLKSPYTVYPGQKLLLEKVAEKSVAVPSRASEKQEVRVEKTPEKVAPKPQEKTIQKTPESVVTGKSVGKTKVITVGRGDTLYSLSRAYSVPVNDLAVMNELRPPFDLKVGQSLRVPDVKEVCKEPVAVATEKSKKQEVKTPVVTPTSRVVAQPKVAINTQKTDAKKSSKTEAKKVEVVKKSEPAKKASGTETKKATSNKTEKQTKNTKESVKEKKETKKTETKTATKQEPQKIAGRSSSKFTWPVRGKILSHYGAKTGGLFNDGINISASMGTSVVAAENGVVAYAGNEVKGMGNLIIIQHADGWMTVYAHLNSMSIRRGARVTVGQKIGTVGKTGKVSTPQLHFEIRKGRKAYNPINYLKK